MNHNSLDIYDTSAHCIAPSKPGEERRIEMVLRPLLAHWGWDACSVEDIVSAVLEAWLNAAEHGNAFDPTLPVEFEATVCCKGSLTVFITDQHADHKPPPRPSLHAGWKVIEAFADEACMYTNLASRKTTTMLRFRVNHLPALLPQEAKPC